MQKYFARMTEFEVASFDLGLLRDTDYANLTMALLSRNPPGTSPPAFETDSNSTRKDNEKDGVAMCH
jgi:hypothetical protein